MRRNWQAAKASLEMNMGWRAACVGVILAVTGAGGASHAWGAGLDATTLPEDTKWVMHLDVDQAKDSGIWQNLQRRLDNIEARGNANANRGMQGLIEGRQRIANLAKGLDITLPGGLHDVTLYGDAYASAGSSMRIHAEISEKHAEDALKGEAGYSRADYSGSVILSWGKAGAAGGVKNFAGFSGKGFVIFSSDEAMVKKGLDALDGKMVLASDSPLNPAPITTPAAVAGVGNGRGGRGGQAAAVVATPVFWLAGIGLGDLQGKGRTESPVLKNLEWASLGAVAIGPQQGGIHMVVRGKARTPEAAQAIQEVVVGIKAGAYLAATAEPNKPRLKVIDDLMQPLTVTVGGQAVQAEWAMRPLPPADLEVLIGLAQQEAAPAGGGRGGPAATQP